MTYGQCSAEMRAKIKASYLFSDGPKWMVLVGY